MQPERALAGLARVAKVITAPFVRYQVRGAEELNANTRVVIIACNHRSLFDIVAGLVVLHRYRRYPRVLIEKKYVDSKWTAPFARAIGAIPVDRAAGRGEAFGAAVDAMSGGASILILPEGRLHWDPADPLSVGRTSTGVSRLAAASGESVVAAGIVGTEHVWPATRPLPRLNPFRRRRLVTVVISDEFVALDGPDPLDPDAELDHRARTDQVMAVIQQQMIAATTWATQTAR